MAALLQRGDLPHPARVPVARDRIGELAQDVLAVSAALADGGPLHLLGHSFGGHVVREAVLTAGRPLPWRSLTLMATGPGAIDPAEAARTKLLLDALPVMDQEAIWEVMQQMEESGGTGRAALRPDVAAFLRRRWLANVPQALAAMGEHLVTAPDRVSELAALPVPLPVQVVSGVRDHAWPVAEQAAMAVRLGADHVVVPEAGHSPNAEQPAATAAVLARFWG